MRHVARATFVVCAGALVFAMGCSDKEPAGAAIVAPQSNDAGATSDATAAADSSQTSAFDACNAECRVTALSATFDAESATLSRAQFGFVKGDGGKQLLHLEAHEGGSPACPTESSPSPDYTLVVEDLPLPADAKTISAKDGVRAALFDFAGTLMGSNVLAKASAIEIHPVAIVKEGDSVIGIALDVNLTFPQGGKLEGHLFAEHCDSMDD